MAISYIIGNQMNTAQSQSACEMMIAPIFSGNKRYARPHMNPAVRAAIISMKLNFEICTRAYTSVVTTNPISGFQRADNLFWTHPRQNISSAGPMMKSIRNVRTQGFSPSFIPYMESTCGRAKSKSRVEKYSPSQKTPHKAAANMIPDTILVRSRLTSFHHCGLAQHVKIVRIAPEHVIIIQKLT